MTPDPYARRTTKEMVRSLVQLGYRRKLTAKPCVCGKPIQPGQLYDPRTGRHIGCARR